MPPVHLETLLRAETDKKVACETLKGGLDELSQPAPEVPSFDVDLPPDSFCLPTLEGEIEWLDRNAFFERKQSIRGGGAGSSSSSLPNSGQLQFAPSQRVSKSSFIGLPKRPESRHIGRGPRRPFSAVRFFPGPSAAASKPTAPVEAAEPRSPKVSCIGRVRPKGKPEIKSPERQHRSWRKFLKGFHLRRQQAVALNEEPSDSRPSFRRRQELGLDAENNIPTSSAPTNEFPSLSGAMKLSSCRRPAGWGDEVAGGAATESRNSKKKDDNVWRRRRQRGPPRSVDCVRDLERVGPASV